MNHVAIVVQRCHESIIGGSEALAWQYAQLLSEEFHVDILTTTAVDYTTWANELPPGIEQHDGIHIRRFPVSMTRTDYWHELHARWLRHYPYAGSGDVTAAARRPSPWTIALEEEFIRKQGPYSKSLLGFLKRHRTHYRTVFFVTYLYPTTYFGSWVVDPARSILIPTLHNEPAAYLKAYKLMARRIHRLVWLTEAERHLSNCLWGPLPGEIIGLPVQTEPAPPARLGYPYVLYCGRIDEGKGSYELVDYFTRMKESHPSALRLVLTGQDKIGLASHPDVVYLGTVSGAEKAALMAGAELFVMPSRWESLSIATLEAMGQGSPILVNGNCPVLVEHVEASGAGKSFVDYPSFCAAISELVGNSEQKAALGAQARRYVLARFQRERVRKALVAQVRGCGVRKASGARRGKAGYDSFGAIETATSEDVIP